MSLSQFVRVYYPRQFLRPVVRIRTIGVTFHYVDIEASIFFWGQMEGMNSTETELSIRLPVQGIHTIVVSEAVSATS